MESLHRLSMNTSLKNARIFDDDAWDDSGEFPVRKIKVESPDSYDEQQPSLSSVEHKYNLDRPIKQETNLNDTTLEEGELEDSFSLDSKDFQTKKIKSDCTDLPSAPLISSEEAWLNIKKSKTPSPPHISDDAIYKVKIENSATESSDHMFDQSPYNKELFKSWRIKESTPLKTDEDYEGPSSSHPKRNCFKSARRTVFNRPSPYETGAGSGEESRVSMQHRQGIKRKSYKEDFISLKRNPSNMETDPECLARREKQIEYGKNTIGYENYLKLVPKAERKPEDPKTPPKYKKYSRRGWEGLIKQWRIRLHQYDPPETPDS